MSSIGFYKLGSYIGPGGARRKNKRGIQETRPLLSGYRKINTPPRRTKASTGTGLRPIAAESPKIILLDRHRSSASDSEFTNMIRLQCAAPEGVAGGVSGSNRAGPSSRMPAVEIARRLNIGRQAVYAMLEQEIIPAVRLGRRWIITRHAYEQWERTCGVRSGIGLNPPSEVMVLN
jgi:excisionase family DNA binding protein